MQLVQKSTTLHIQHTYDKIITEELVAFVNKLSIVASSSEIVMLIGFNVMFNFCTLFNNCGYNITRQLKQQTLASSALNNGMSDCDNRLARVSNPAENTTQITNH